MSMNTEDFLDKYIFGGLKNLNDGFDAKAIKYFSGKDFEVVLVRVEEYGLGITGIEPWLNGDFYSVAIYESYETASTDPKWYKTAFQGFAKSGKDLQYSATYYVPEDLLK